jgi:hypothetical protein
MKTVDLANHDGRVDDLLDQAESDDLVLRAADGRRFLLVEIDDFDEEVARTSKNDALMALLDERLREPGRISLEEARLRLGLNDE